MGEVVQLRDYQPDALGAKLRSGSEPIADDLKALLSRPVDTAPSEYSAPDDGDCA